jgi:CRP-like cAMP-binding protein
VNPESHSAFDVFCRLAGAELPDRLVLDRAIKPRVLRAGEPLFRAGERQPHVFVVNRGVIKMLYETPKGDAWVKGFAEAGVCFASLTALEGEGRASYSAVAETEAAVEQIAFEDVQQLAGHHLAWQRAIGNAFRFYGQRKEQREMELLTLSPEDRYLSFIRRHPALAALLRQRDIASYVRVTPVALSRIKSRVQARSRA